MSTTEPALKNDADLLTDLEIIALNEPGKGQALKRIIDRAGMTNRQMAEKLGYDPESDAGRTTLSQWFSERRWPPAARIREVLVHCNIDRKVLLDKFGIALGTEVTPIAETRQLLVSLRNELMFEFDEFERQDIIFNNTREKVLLFQAFKAFDDVRAAQLYFERLDKHEEEKRRRGGNEPRNVTPQQSAWNAGQDVTEAPSRPLDTTTCSETTPDNSAEPKPSADLVDNKQA
jgi:transcriptional regulator with XRE-family HTH domain